MERIRSPVAIAIRRTARCPKGTDGPLTGTVPFLWSGHVSGDSERGSCLTIEVHSDIAGPSRPQILTYHNRALDPGRAASVRGEGSEGMS